MKYFAIEYSLNEKMMGSLPQVKEVIHNCHVDNEPRFIDKFPFEEIKIEPILSNIKLCPNSKLTDIIMTGSIGFSFGSILISDRFKELLEQFNCYGIQFFPTHLVHKNEKNDSYWQTHIYKVPYNCVDFSNTDVLLKDRDENRKPIKRYLDKTNEESFLSMVNFIKYPKMLFLKNVAFKENMNYDYFHMRYTEGNNCGIVSEKLKKEIEKNELTGIEFRPLELTLEEWYERNKINRKI